MAVGARHPWAVCTALLLLLTAVSPLLARDAGFDFEANLAAPETVTARAARADNPAPSLALALNIGVYLARPSGRGLSGLGVSYDRLFGPGLDVKILYSLIPDSWRRGAAVSDTSHGWTALYGSWDYEGYPGRTVTDAAGDRIAAHTMNLSRVMFGLDEVQSFGRFELGAVVGIGWATLGTTQANINGSPVPLFRLTNAAAAEANLRAGVRWERLRFPVPGGVSAEIGGKLNAAPRLDPQANLAAHPQSMFIYYVGLRLSWLF
ncbi:MAG: hypothetical protein ACREJ2_00790 [Planctomycetota bacterium]